jgi:DNA-binding MarR family transcriptional regulator/GNAT superfamily N-acetyltransferase
MNDPAIDSQVAAFRRFNRFYTRRIGALDEGLLGSGLSLVECRVLFEIAAGAASASTLSEALGLDPGYVSRMLKKLIEAGLVAREADGEDGRRKSIALSTRGRRQFEKLDALSSQDAGRVLGALADSERRALIRSMRRVESILGGSPESAAFVIREPRPGDLGWVVAAHAEIYSREYGYGPEFEALVARIVADFASRRGAARERCWIADRDGEAVGSVFLVELDEATAKLRLLILDPSARGQGLGRRLVDECLAFARSAGYRKVVLWTNSELAAARGIYAAAGFALVSSEPDPMFPAGLGENWELAL